MLSRHDLYALTQHSPIIAGDWFHYLNQMSHARLQWQIPLVRHVTKSGLVIQRISAAGLHWPCVGYHYSLSQDHKSGLLFHTGQMVRAPNLARNCGPMNHSLCGIVLHDLSCWQAGHNFLMAPTAVGPQPHTLWPWLSAGICQPLAAALSWQLSPPLNCL